MFGFGLQATKRSATDAPLRVFISYSHKDIVITDRIADALTNRNIVPLVDRRDLPFAQRWKDELEVLIQRSDTVIWLVSEHSVTSEWVDWELATLKRLNKRLVPIKVGEIDPEKLPEAINEQQLLPLLESDDFSSQLDKLVETLLVPRSWVKMHTWLADQARRGSNRLRGQDLKDAETWLLEKPAVAEPPTDEIIAFIRKSGRISKRNKNLTVAASLLGMAFAIGGAWYSNEQRLAAVAAEAEAKVSEKKALVSESKALALVSEQKTENGDATTGLLLALEALPDLKEGRERPMVVDPQRSLYQALFTLRERSVLDGHEGPLTYAETNEDGSLVLTSSQDGKARLWTAKGDLISTLEGHSRPVNMARFSPDFSRILTISDDQTGVLWDKNGSQITRLRGHRKPIRYATFSDDSRYILTTSSDYTAKLWSADDGQHYRDFKIHGLDVIAADFSPDSATIALASADGTASLWAIDDVSKPIILDGHDNKRLRSIAFSPKGDFIATTSRDQRAILWALDGSIHQELDGHEGVVNSLRFGPEASLAVTASDDNTAKIWDASTGDAISTLQGHQSRIVDAEFSRDGSKIMTASVDGAIGLWKIDESKVNLLAMLRGHDSDIAAAKFSGDGDWIVSSSQDRTARLWRATEQPLFSKDLRHDCDLRSLAFSQDGKNLATACKAGLVTIWDMETLEIKQQKDLQTKQIISLSFSTIGRSIALAHEDGSVTLRDTDTLEPIGKAFLGHRQRVRSVDFNSTDTELVTSSADGTAKVWQIETQKEILSLEDHEDRVRSAIFSDDGQIILTVSADRTAKLWDSQTGELIDSFNHHSDDVWAADFSSDGQLFVTGSEDGQVFITDTARAHPPRALIGHGDNVRSAEFSGDGQYILTSSWDRTVKLWDAATGQTLASIPSESIILDAAFDPTGKRIAYLVRNLVRLRPIYPSADDLIAAAKATKPRDLSDEERRVYLSE